MDMDYMESVIHILNCGKWTVSWTIALHPLTIHYALIVMGHGELELIPADNDLEEGYTLDTLSVYHSTNV